MLLLAEGRRVRCYVERLDGPRTPHVPFGGRCFPCLVWDHSGVWTQDERQQLALGLIRQQCRYALCAGREADYWSGAFDVAFVDEYLDEPDAVRDAKDVMTAAFADEPPAEVAEFFLLSTNFDYHYFSDFLVLHIGTGPEMAVLDEALKQLVRGDEAL